MKKYKIYAGISIITIVVGVIMLIVQISVGGVQSIIQFLICECIGIILFGNLISYLTASFYECQYLQKKHYVIGIFYFIINLFFIGVFWYIALIIHFVS